jgi:ATP-dependent Clp protease ATP-binding subunit ClpC
MFERFDPTARRAVARARDEASGNAIDSLHLLTAIAASADPAGELLANHGVTLDTLTAAPRRTPTGAHAGPFAGDGRRALEHALASCMVNGRDTVTTADLLVGVLNLADDTPAGESLAAHGVRLASLVSDARDLARNVNDDAPYDGDADPVPTTPAGGREGRRARKGEKALREFATNLTDEARAGRLDPVIGRDREIDQVVITLGRRTKCNPVLVGPAGAGKTAILEGLAQRIAAGDVPEHLTDAEVWNVDVGSLTAGTRLRGDFEERVKAVINAASRPGVVLAIDELHTVMGLGTGAQNGGAAMSDMLKPALSRGELRVVGATTDDEYRQIAKDAAMERRFSPVHVTPFDPAAARKVLAAVAPRYADHHCVTITDDALDAAVRLADRYLVDRRLPDSAIDVLDEAGAAVTVSRSLGRDVSTTVDGAAIAAIVAGMVGMDVGTITEERADRLVHLEENLRRVVIGQDEACAVVAGAARRAGAGLRDLRRPVANFLFCGPTGVGKTLMATQLAEAFYGDAGAISVFDMSEFSEEHTVAQLLGAPPGYVGHDEGGRLPEAIRRRRGQVLLFDEVEKAHPRVYDALMALLDEGRVTGADGRVADATEAVVVMTSNLGTAQLGRAAVGFNHARRGDDPVVAQAAVNEALREFFRPEFLNRVDTTVVFAPLAGSDLRAIAHAEVGHLAGRVAELGVALDASDAAADVLAAHAAADSGARGIRRAVTTLVENPLVDLRLAGRLAAGSRVHVDVAPDGSLWLAVDADEAGGAVRDLAYDEV